jgi:hypothetical protein
MSDLIQRLRRCYTAASCDDGGQAGLAADCRKAADELERQSETIAGLRAELAEANEYWNPREAQAEIKALRERAERAEAKWRPIAEVVAEFERDPGMKALMDTERVALLRRLLADARFEREQMRAALAELVERCAKVAEKSRAVPREYPYLEHWKEYEKEWGLRTLVANEIAENIRALSEPQKEGKNDA